MAVFNSCALCIQQHRECQQGAIINIALSVQCAPITIGLSWEKVCAHKRLNPREIVSILLLFHQLSATKETREFLWFIIDKQVYNSNSAWNLVYNRRFHHQVIPGGQREKNVSQKLLWHSHTINIVLIHGPPVPQRPWNTSLVEDTTEKENHRAGSQEILSAGSALSSIRCWWELTLYPVNSSKWQRAASPQLRAVMGWAALVPQK